MPPAGFEPAIPAGEKPQNHALDRAATGTRLYCAEYQVLCITYKNGRPGSIPGQSVEVNGGHSGTRTSFSPSTSAFPCQYPSTNAPYSSPFTRHLSQRQIGTAWEHSKSDSVSETEDGVAENYFHFSDVSPNTLTTLLSSSPYPKQSTCHHFTPFTSQRSTLPPTYFYRKVLPELSANITVDTKFLFPCSKCSQLHSVQFSHFQILIFVLQFATQKYTN